MSVTDPFKQPHTHPTPLATSAATDGVRELVLEKRGERFAFICRMGEEEALLEQLIHMVRDPDCPLDWFDAAVLSRQMGCRLGDQLRKMMRA